MILLTIKDFALFILGTIIAAILLIFGLTVWSFEDSCKTTGEPSAFDTKKFAIIYKCPDTVHKYSNGALPEWKF